MAFMIKNIIDKIKNIKALLNKLSIFLFVT